jgi:hypothetical protein
MKNLKQYLPYLIAIIIFFVLASVYFAPHYSGYGLRQYDIQHAIGMSKEASDYKNIDNAEPLWTNSCFGGMPAYQVLMTNNSNLIPKLEGWIFLKFLGAAIGFLLIAMISFYILLLCFEVDPWTSIIGAIAFGFSTVNFLYLGSGHITKVHAIALLPGIIGSMIYGYRKNVRVGSVLLCLFVCLHISANHIQQTYNFLFLAAAIIIVELYISFKERILPAFLKKSLILLAAAIIGLLPAMSGLLLTYEHGKYTTRGKSELTISADNNKESTSSEGLESWYIKQYSLGYGEVWSIAVPNIKGGASGYLSNNQDKIKNVSPEYKEFVSNQNSYWGEQFGSGGPFYFGATIFLLFILGMVFIKDRIKWAFLAASILAVILSWKYSSILDFFIEHFPLFNKFRDTKMMLILVQISLPFIGVLFLKELFLQKIDKKKLNYTLLATIGIFILFYIMPSVWFNFFSYDENQDFNKQLSAYSTNINAIQQIEQAKSEIQNVRIAIFQSDVLRSIFFMFLIGVLVLLYNRDKISKKWLLISVGLLVLIDLWNVDKRILNNNKVSGVYKNWVKNDEGRNPYRATVADMQILSRELKNDSMLAFKINQELNNFESTSTEVEKEQKAFSLLNRNTDYRVLLLPDPFSDASISYFHKSIGGYHGAKLKIFQELIEFRLIKELQSLINAINSKNNTLLYNALRQTPSLNMLNTRYIVTNPDAAPIINPFANGSVWFVKNIQFVENLDNEILSLDSINPTNTAVIENKYSSQIQNNFKYDSASSITLKTYKPNHLTYQTNAINPQIAVFSEIYYKDGWNVYIDGIKDSYFRANYVLRGMYVPSGNHTIEFKFEPTIYNLSKNISFAGSALIVLFVLGMLGLEFRRKIT